MPEKYFSFPRILDGLSQTVSFGQMVFKLFLFSREQVIGRLNSQVNFPLQLIYLMYRNCTYFC